MFVTNWISTTKIQKISEITNFFRHYFLSRTEVFYFTSFSLGLHLSEERILQGGHILRSPVYQAVYQEST